MSVDVIMPKLGESITEGTILEWKKSVGDTISKDETLLEISTDKVDSEVPSPAEGKITDILYDVNDVVAVGEVIAKIGGDGDPINEGNVEKNDAPEKQVEKNEPTVEKNKHVDINISDSKNRGCFYSPLVKSIAKKENISLSQLDSISGSGENGRVNKSDIINFINNKDSFTLENNTIELLSDSSKKYDLQDKIEPMDHVRKVIAKHMKASRETSVHVYSTSEVDMTNIVNYRNKNKSSFMDKYKTPLTYTPFIIDASIKAIQEFPLMNAFIQEENIKFNQNINIGVAVALPDDNLIVPVIKRSEELNFLGIARSTNELAVKARNNNLSPDDALGSTFTITNPGIFGSLFGMGIINQPNVGLLSVGSIHKRPVVKETEYGDVIVPRSMMYLTLAYDHRLIDGAYGTKFLSKLKSILENFSSDDI